MRISEAAVRRASSILALSAAAQAGAGLVAFIAISALNPPSPPLFLLAEIAVFLGVGGFLLRRGGEDVRSNALGLVFVLISSSFATTPLERIRTMDSFSALLLGRLALALPSDAFLAYAFWAFVRIFPRTVEVRWDRIARAGAVMSAAAGGLLWIGSALAALGVGGWSRLARVDPTSDYWVISLLLLPPPLVFGLVKSRRAPEVERKRAALVVAGVLAATLPAILLAVCGAASPSIDGFLTGTVAGRVAMQAGRILLLTVPLSAAYAVVVDRVFDVRLAVRMTLRHALAKIIVGAAILVPFSWFAWQLGDQRAVPLGDLFSLDYALPLGLPLSLAALALALRKGAVDRMDRAFFRKPYDARRLMIEVAEKSRAAKSADELMSAIAGEVDRALHPERIAVLLLDEERRNLVAQSGGLRPLSLDSSLCREVAAGARPMELDLERPGARVAVFNEEERTWIAESGCTLFVPLIGTGGSLLGCLSLGPRKSDLPYDRDEHLMLSAVAGAAALALESHVARRAPVAAAPEPASECPECGALAAAGGSCLECGTAMTGSSVPLVFLDKFRFERRIGRGGMGVVYRAMDVTLNRPVAVKTLPACSPEESVHLRREARAMAKVAHPNLAQIYGAESWRGVPLLIVEFLAEGSLSDRLARRGPLPAQEVIALGVQLFSALSHIHRAGVLHRDVKPSNVGRTDDGVWKLMDFGVAQIVSDAAPERTGGTAQVMRPDQTQVTAGYVGTPLYMSPEALWYGSKEASVDLWAASMSLYEAILGRHPYAAMESYEVQRRLQQAEVPDLRTVAPECPPVLADLLHRGLHRDPRKRPNSAGTFERELRALNFE